jgi:hypothetical protein
LAVTTETGVSFAVAVEVGCEVPGSVRVVEVEHGAFTDIEEKTDVLATPFVFEILVSFSCHKIWGMRLYILLKMLVTATKLVGHAAYSL